MKKILIIRFSSIGDIVLTSPVVRCIKEQTQAEVHYITKKAYVPIVFSNPHIDKVHHIEKEITEIVDLLKAEKYDFVVDLHHNLRSLRLRNALGRPSATFPKLNVQKWLMTNFKINRLPNRHIVDRYFEAVEPLGIKNDQKGLDYFIPDKQELILEEYNIPAQFIAFVIGAKFATKRLPEEQIIAIIRATKLPVVLLGGSEDEHMAGAIVKACPDCISLVGKVNLHESASVVQQATKVVTHDTGLMHIAAAFKKEIISIWGNTIPEFGMYPYMPGQESNYSVHQVEVSCRPCSKIGYSQCPKKHFKCMRLQDIDVISQYVNK